MEPEKNESERERERHGGCPLVGGQVVMRFSWLPCCSNETGGDGSVPHTGKSAVLLT